MVGHLTRLGAYKFVSFKECSYNLMVTKVSSLSSRDKEGRRFQCIRGREGSFIVLVETREKKLIEPVLNGGERFIGEIRVKS